MRLLTPPGVFRPRSDSRLLAGVVRDARPEGLRVLDLCTGSGIVAISAAQAGAAWVVAVDTCRRSVATASFNARLNRTRIDGRVGDLYEPVAGERFDLVVSNPPYLPGVAPDELASRDPARAWEGGPDGRVVLDRVIDGAPAHLRPGGALLVLHSSVCSVEATMARMAAAGLHGEVVVRSPGPLGPLLTARAPMLEARGLIEPGDLREDVVVVRAVAP